MAFPELVEGGSKSIWRDHTLRADMEVRPDPTHPCPIMDVDTDVEGIQSILLDDECRVDLTLPDGRVVRTGGSLPEQNCFCCIFQEFDSVPHFEGIEDGVIRISTYLEDRSEIKSLLEEIRTITISVRLVRLTAIVEETGRQTVLLDMDILTEKQREALELAVERGYYDDRDIDMESLAAELDISSAAFSQRLKRGQANIASELIG